METKKKKKQNARSDEIYFIFVYVFNEHIGIMPISTQTLSYLLLVLFEFMFGFIVFLQIEEIVVRVNIPYHRVKFFNATTPGTYTSIDLELRVL